MAGFEISFSGLDWKHCTAIHWMFVCTGLIIDAFGELRDQQEQVKEDMEVLGSLLFDKKKYTLSFLILIDVSDFTLCIASPDQMLYMWYWEWLLRYNATWLWDAYAWRTQPGQLHVSDSVSEC